MLDSRHVPSPLPYATVIDVRLYADLARSSGDETVEFQVEARAGLTVKDVVNESGIRAEDVHIVMINGRGAGLDSSLSDGDRLALFPAISGG